MLLQRQTNLRYAIIQVRIILFFKFGSIECTEANKMLYLK